VFHITTECSVAFTAQLIKGSVMQQVYAAKGGGINFRTVNNERRHVDNNGNVTER